MRDGSEKTKAFKRAGQAGAPPAARPLSGGLRRWKASRWTPPLLRFPPRIPSRNQPRSGRITCLICPRARPANSSSPQKTSSSSYPVQSAKKESPRLFRARRAAGERVASDRNTRLTLNSIAFCADSMPGGGTFGISKAWAIKR
jgi:hypothetical protein